MKPTPTALGYLRTDISGPTQPWDEQQIRSLARRLGYRLLKTIAFSTRTDDPIQRLTNVIEQLDIDAIIVPGPHHFDDNHIPERITRIADVITLDPKHLHPRHPIRHLPEPDGAFRRAAFRSPLHLR